MTVVVAVPAMTMPVANLDDNLRIRCRNQRREEQKGEEAEHDLLHAQWDAE
jgi:hypothetical protein